MRPLPTPAWLVTTKIRGTARASRAHRRDRTGEEFELRPAPHVVVHDPTVDHPVAVEETAVGRGVDRSTRRIAVRVLGPGSPRQMLRSPQRSGLDPTLPTAWWCAVMSGHELDPTELRVAGGAFDTGMGHAGVRMPNRECCRRFAIVNDTRTASRRNATETCSSHTGHMAGERSSFERDCSRANQRRGTRHRSRMPGISGAPAAGEEE